MGQLLQRHIYLDLQTKLGQHNIDVKLNSTIPGVSHQQTGKRDTNFDIVVSKAEKYIAIDTIFQNSCHRWP